MAEPRRQERRSVWRVGPESTWTTVLPVAFIIVSLVSLAVLPIVSEKRTAQMRREISTAAEPARRTANAVQVDLAAELDKIIAYQVTKQPQYRAQYEQLLAQHSRAVDMLRRLVPDLNPEVGKQLEVLIANSDDWHAAVQAGGFMTPMPTEV